jgi:hydroxymethylpyrimidine pyrophosphatase-like HAD family hydrolase
MKVIFLDIDGVLCTRRSHLAYGKEGGIWHEWDPLAVEVIRKCCERGVKIVLSSTWRKPSNLEHFHEQYAKYGMNPAWLYQPDWKTPITTGRRGEEIKQWLNRHPEVTDYRIVDDDNDMLHEQHAKCIFTDAEDGMTSENIKKLLNWSGVLKA